MKKNAFSYFVCVICAVMLSSPSFAARDFDVAVIGGGSGGCAAAIQAARLGARTVVVEETGWLGGQMTAAAVCTMDDQWRTRYGIYWEFIKQVRAHYDKTGTPIDTGLWSSDTLCFEPRAGRDALEKMLEDAGVTVFLDTRTVGAVMDGNSVVGAKVLINRLMPDTIVAKVFIDATECGDFIPMTGAAYRAGNSVWPDIDMDAAIQDITYVAVIKKYHNTPCSLIVKEPPSGYDEARFVGKVASNGLRDGGYPLDWAKHIAYRGLPDIENRLPIDGDDPQTWPNITRTCINFANDYPGEDGYLSVRYLEDKFYRREIDRQAALRTLEFMYYFQNVMGETAWAVDMSQGYGGDYYKSLELGSWNEGAAWMEILRQFPPIPYVRESRRIVGLYTLNAMDLRRDKYAEAAYKNFPTSIALGEYQVDMHGAKLDKWLEHDLGDHAELFPKDWVGSEGVYQIPFEALIPQKTDGLIAAEKNISVSRMASGSTRLQPVTMHTGQAAGAIAAIAAKKNIRPREVQPLAVQRELLNGGVRLALEQYDDVGPDDPYWPAVQAASLYGWLRPDTEKLFAPEDWITRRDAQKLLQNFVNISLPKTDVWISEREYAAALGLSRESDSPITRGMSINLLIEAILK